MAPSTSSAYSAATVTRETRPAPSNDRVVGMMDAAYFVGRRELLDWINTTLELNVQRIEDTCSGAVACQLMDCIQPNTVPMSKVNWGAKDEYAMICNYKLLQSAFDRARVSKPVEVNRLIRGKYQDNLEFMQWFKAFYDGQRPVDGYDPVLARRKSKNARAAPEGAPAAAAARGPPRAAAPRRAKRAPSGARAPAKAAAPPADENRPPAPPRGDGGKAAAARDAELLEALEAVENERDFYFKKLQAVEAALRCRPPGDTAAALAKDVYRVLYEASEPDLAALGEAPAPALAPGAACSPILEEAEPPSQLLA